MADAPISSREVSRWAETVSSIARTSLAFSENSYDRERWEELLEVAADMQASVATDRSAEEHLAAWTSSIANGVPGYVTPKVGVGAYVGNDEGKLLLIQRSDSHRWFFPTGWCDVGYSPSEVVIKEVLEECGLDVVPEKLIAVVDGMQAGSPIPHYNLVFLCRLVGGDLRRHPVETEDIGWFGEDELPEPLVGRGVWKEQAFAAIRGQIGDTLFDPPRTPVWRPAPGEV